MKHPVRSWTILFNVVLIGVGIAYPDLSDAVRITLINAGLVNIGLRFKTKLGVKI